MHDYPAMLYVPGDDESKLAKIPLISSCGFIIDLEDAVAESVKPRARELAKQFIIDHPGQQGLYIRVNGFATEMLYDDVIAVVVPGIRGVVLPKASTPSQIEILDWLIGVLEKKRGIDVGTTEIMPIIEEPSAIENIVQLAKASPRIHKLSFGAGDFCREIGVDWHQTTSVLSPTLLHVRARLVTVSRALGLHAPHDTVFPNFRDLEGLRSEALGARAMGFGGKHAIHPSQVTVINTAFHPSEEEVEWARGVVEAFSQSESQGRAAIQVNGHFVDYPVFERAQELLERVASSPAAEEWRG